jgi:hypothetical protein
MFCGGMVDCYTEVGSLDVIDLCSVGWWHVMVMFCGQVFNTPIAYCGQVFELL